MRCAKVFLAALCACGAVMAPSSLVGADEAPGAETAIGSVEQPPADEAAAPAEVDSGDNAWMLASAALVLMMTAPGLALFYCGLVRKKNVLSVMMQCIFLMCMMTVIWGLWGFSLAFGGDPSKADAPWYAKFVGNGHYLFMENVEHDWDESTDMRIERVRDNTAIPQLTFMAFQGMFFIITPALICGAFAERMKFSAMALFMALWGTLIYCPLAHWVWGGGILAFGGNHSISGGALDFAGGTVVHISSGVTALVCALLIGKRLGYGSQDLRPHNLTYTAIGTALLWVGWFGFNAGSALAADSIAASAFVATHFAAAAGGLGWAGVEWVLHKRPTILGTCSGVVAGLVCITPASGHVIPLHALVMGLAAGVVCYFACAVVKAKFGYDDSLDVFGIHGVGGTLGAILTGVFATRAVWDVAEGAKLGLLEGGAIMAGQIAAVGVTWVFAIVGSLILLKIVDLLVGLRVSQEEETRGLDLTQHNEEGYIFS
jgi:ammonium transporter, Amt family